MKNIRPGFTLVEVVVAISIATALLVGMAAIFPMLIAESSEMITDTTVKKNLSDGMSSISDDVHFTRQFLKAPLTGYVDSDPVRVASIAGQGVNKRALFLAQPTTTRSPFDAARKAIYKNIDCAVPRQPYYSNVIYFLDGQNLTRRTLLASSQATCNGEVPYQKHSCKNGAGAVARCQQKDQVVAKGIEEFRVQYYDDDSITSTIAEGDVYNISLANLGEVKSIQVSLKARGSDGSLQESRSILSSPQIWSTL